MFNIQCGTGTYKVTRKCFSLTKDVDMDFALKNTFLTLGNHQPGFSLFRLAIGPHVAVKFVISGIIATIIGWEM